MSVITDHLNSELTYPVSLRQHKIASELRAKKDLILIEEYRHGRTEAFDELTKFYHERVKTILLKMHAPIDDIEDLEQNVFLKIFRNLHKFRSDSTFYTWVYRITSNVFFDYAKSLKRSNVRMERVQIDLLDTTNIHDEEIDPYFICYNYLIKKDFQNAIKKIEEPYRDIIYMRVIDEMPYEEIAKKSNITTSTVRSRIARGRAQLRQILELSEYHSIA